MLEVILLLSFTLIAAVIAVEIRSLLSAVVALGVVGFALCVLFFVLRAPDVAITQLIVEVLILVMLIRATGVKRDLTEYGGGLREFFAVASVLFFILVFGLFAVWALHHIPTFGEPLMTVSGTYIKLGLAKQVAPNVVTAVLLNFRGYDTMGEVTVLFAAVMGVLAVLRGRGRKKKDERNV